MNSDMTSDSLKMVTSAPSVYGSSRRALLTWLFMVGATGVAWWVADRGLGGAEVVGLLFGLAFVKGSMVILDYMAIRHAPLLWRFVTLGWLTLVCLLIGVAYWKGLHG